jgi:GNAT superfamily N-acetyltransferase
MCYQPVMRPVVRPVASLQELAEAFDLIAAQLPRRLTHHDRRFADLACRFPADRALMLVAEDRGRIVGGALAFRTDPAAPAGSGVTLRLVAVAPPHRGVGLGRRLVERVEAAAVRLGAREVSLGADDAARGFYLRLGYGGRARLRKQLPCRRAASDASQRSGAVTSTNSGGGASGGAPPPPPARRRTGRDHPTTATRPGPVGGPHAAGSGDSPSSSASRVIAKQRSVSEQVISTASSTSASGTPTGSDRVT